MAPAITDYCPEQGYIYAGMCTVVDKPNIKNGRRKVHDLPEYNGEQRKTHRYVSKILLYQLCFILFDVSKFHLQEVSVLSRLKDHYYVYSALLQMVELLLKERTLDCLCKKRHAKKMACQKKWLAFSKQSAEWIIIMLWWVVSIFVIDVYLLIYLE